jgi:hypothetical protein
MTRRTLRAGALCCLVLGASQGTHAMDPTQPPAAARVATSAPNATPAAAPAQPRLQGLRLGAAPSALISGQVLRPGQRWQGYTLLRIEVDSAVLRDPEGRHMRLNLLTPPSPAMLAPSGVQP